MEQDVNNSAFNKARTIIFSSSLKEIKLDKSYKNAYELAEKMLKSTFEQIEEGQKSVSF